ncbi:hypothetical protein TWF594_011872 [Orbilia oligospora]|nr:hypothetical protein TWF594_011872 [Orbilia oligospora]
MYIWGCTMDCLYHIPARSAQRACILAAISPCGAYLGARGSEGVTSLDCIEFFPATWSARIWFPVRPTFLVQLVAGIQTASYYWTRLAKELARLKDFEERLPSSNISNLVGSESLVLRQLCNEAKQVGREPTRKSMDPR